MLSYSLVINFLQNLSAVKNVSKFLRGEKQYVFSWLELGCYCVSEIVWLLFPANHRCPEPYDGIAVPIKIQKVKET